MLTRREFLTRGVLLALPLLQPLLAVEKLKLIYRALPATGEMVPGISLGAGSAFDGDWSKFEETDLMMIAFANLGGELLLPTEQGVAFPSVFSQLSGHRISKTGLRIPASLTLDAANQTELMMEQMGRQQVEYVTIVADAPVGNAIHSLEKLYRSKKIRHAGIAATEAAVSELPEIWKSFRISFVEIPYHIYSGESVEKVLTRARKNNVGIFVTDPFMGEKVPVSLDEQIAGDSFFQRYSVRSTAQAHLKYILSHPAVTTILAPASNSREISRFMEAGTGLLPEGRDREIFREKLFV